jgi:hypothetical protein
MLPLVLMAPCPPDGTTGIPRQIVLLLMLALTAPYPSLLEYCSSFLSTVFSSHMYIPLSLILPKILYSDVIPILP